MKVAKFLLINSEFITIFIAEIRLELGAKYEENKNLK